MSGNDKGLCILYIIILVWTKSAKQNANALPGGNAYVKAEIALRLETCICYNKIVGQQENTNEPFLKTKTNVVNGLYQY